MKNDGNNAGGTRRSAQAPCQDGRPANGHDQGAQGQDPALRGSRSRRIIGAAGRSRDWLLEKMLWLSGGGVREVGRLRRSDVDPKEGTVLLVSVKQRRRERRPTRVYVSLSLVA